MSKKILAGLAMAASLIVVSTQTAFSQSAYFQAVTNLQPAAYWPLQETALPPAADVEPNLGSLGAVANAFYSSTNVIKGMTGIPSGDSDPAVGIVSPTNGSFLAVPLTDSRVSLPAGPFTVEAWVFPTNAATASTIIAQTGVAGSGGLNGSANSAGWSLNLGYIPSLGVTMPGTVSFHVYNGAGSTGGAEATFTTNSSLANVWHHVVAVFDGVNARLYVDTSPGVSMARMTGTQVRDTWDPLTIGCGRGLNNNRFAGSLDEIAIYTNVLSLARITAHFNTGNGGAGGYQAAVAADSPYMYWRMNAPGYTAPSLSAYPVAANFGNINNASGLYLSGTIPGVAGPPLSGFGSPSYACAFNGIGTDGTNRIQLYTNGIPVGTTPSTSGVILTNMDPALNLVSNNVTFMCWFKANPADTARGFQSIMCNGDRSWRMSLSENAGQFGTVRVNPAEGGEIVSATVINDGNWHFAVDVYTNAGPASPSGWLGTNYLYVDGILQASAFTTNTAAIGVSSNVMIGCSSEFAVSGNGNVYQPQRHFPGSIAHAAYFTNSLSAAQVANLYVAAGGVPLPVITGQPVTGRINGAGGNNGSGSGSFIFFGVNSVGATGYQWFFNSASNYSGATQLVDGPKYINAGTLNVTVTNLADSDSGYYYVVVTNNYGSVTSILATLQVHTEPFIVSQTPAAGPFTLYQNQNFTLSVSAIGQTNFSYLWYTNGVADSAAGTASTYPLTSVQPAMSGRTFQCVVANGSGSATSAVVTLSVQSLPGALTSSTFSSTLLGLNPSGYWPMHEAAPAAPGDVETNLGSLGNLANGYYADWVSPLTFINHSFSGALAGDNDPAVLFNNAANGANPGYLVIPRTTSAATLRPPLTLEAWAKPVNAGFGDIISQGPWGANANGTSGSRSGIRMAWGSGGTSANAAADFQIYIGPGTGTANPAFPGSVGQSLPIGQWYHAVLTTADGTNWTFYVNGSVHTSFTLPLGVDSGDPIVIGQGLWQNNGPQRAFPGAIDEVAIYTNALDPAEIANHYATGINPSPSISYKQMVLNTNPIIYLRMNAPAYAQPAPSTWPVLNNYGAVGGNGVYSPGSMPGAISGPPALGLPGTTAMPGNGMSSFADAGNDPSFNPTTNAFSYSAWFKGYPCDARTNQTIVGRSESSFRAGLNAAGKLQAHAGGNDITSGAVYNDGNWHHFLMTYSGTNSAISNFGTNILYVDGVQVGTSTGVGNAGTNLHVLFGNDPQFTNGPVGTGRCLAGSVCEVAFWNNVAISSNQVVSLWNAAGVLPSITSQPVSAAVNELAAFTNRVGVSGSGPLAYRWYYNASSNYNGTAMTDSLDGRVTGTATAALGITNVHASDAGYYYVVATNNVGATTSAIVNLSVFTIPVISSYLPITYTNLYLLFAGASPTFKIVSVSGAAPISYYWYTNGVKDATVAATTTSYQLHNLPVGSASVYCVLSNFVGMTTSFVWTASVGPAPAAPYPTSVLSLNPVAYLRLNEADDGLSDGNPGAIAHDYWNGNDGIYTNTLLAQQGYSVGLANQYGDASLATDPGTTAAQFGTIQSVDSAVLSIAGVDFSGPTNTSHNFSIATWAKATITAQPNGVGLVTKGYGNGGEQFDMDLFGNTYRFFVRDAGGAVHGPTSTVHIDGNWHQIVGVCDQSDGIVSLYVDGVSVASTSIPPGAGILASTNFVSIGARKSGINATSYDFQFQGYMNDVAFYNYALSAGQVASNYIAAGVIPEITQQPPANISGPEGGTLTIPAAALGSFPLSFDWFDASVLSSIPGGTNASLVISNLNTSLDGHTLHLIVTNTYGQVTSSDVLVSVVSGPPQIIVSNLPPEVLLPLGKSYTYSVQVTGTVPFYYQWYNNGNPLAGQTLSSFTITGNALGTSNISLVVSNIHSPPTATGSSVLTVIPLPTDIYATNILGLHPVGYWPLQETNPPGPVTMETNYGTLGHLGNAYYAMNVVASPRINFNQGGALGSPAVGADNDPAVAFTGPSATNYAFVPQVTPALALHPPMSFETWLYVNGNVGFADLLSQGGAGLNVVSSNSLFAGIRMSYGGGASPNLQVYSYNGVATGPNSYDSFGTPTGTLPLGAWHHCVMTFDGSTCILYIDGVEQASSTIRYRTNSWTPFTIADGRWLGDAGTFGPTRSFSGTMDEVAVYTNVLTPLEVTNHFAAGMFTGSYFSTVVNDKPLLYYRMDSSGFVNPDPNTYPIAVNYGSAPVNGGYQGAVPPGGVPGPHILGLSRNVAAPINGVISCLDASNDVSFNPTNREPFSAMLWFRGYPGDGRVQTLMSHGVTNWAMNLDGSTGRIVWNLFNGGNLTSTSVLNDGNWHMAVGVFDGTGSSLYVDGALNISTNAVLAGLAGEPGANLFIGGSPDFTNVGVNQRYWGGAVAQAAMFTNALTSAQIAHLYSVATVPTISIGYVGSSVVITYNGTLVSSSDVTQPLSTWTPVPGATPPTYVVPTSGAQKFYRARNP